METILRDRIASGEIPLDKPVPTELELCKEFEISRPTVRQAIKALELERHFQIESNLIRLDKNAKI